QSPLAQMGYSYPTCLIGILFLGDRLTPKKVFKYDNHQGNKKPQYALGARVRVFSGGESWGYQ
ncbi:hypothetical protein C7B79_34680, partial [Chroococcidiopsis cubana CCALA 043]